MADAPPQPSGQRSVTLDIGAIGSGLGDGIDIEEAYRLVAAAMENDAELMAAVGAARERAVETVRGNLAAKSARGGLEEYRRALDAEFEGTIPPAEKPTTHTRLGSTCHSSAFARTVATILARSAWGCGKLTSPVPLVT